jgi:hypothetical protein
MDKNKSLKTDEEIVGEFDRLFDEIPEPDTNEEIEEVLVDASYDLMTLRAKGLEFVNNLIANNWRFVTSEEIDEEAKRVNETPFRDSWGRNRLLEAIQKVLEALAPIGVEPVLAFRNREKLTDTDLASILQELEYKANTKGIKLDLD